MSAAVSSPFRVQCDGALRLLRSAMTVHLVNPSHLSFGVGVITPRWLFVLGAATPAAYGPPRIVDETLEPLDLDTIHAGDVVGIGIHTGNALRGYEIGTAVRARGATVVFGGIHATLYPEEAHERGGAHTVVRGDGDVMWPLVIDHAVQGTLQPRYEGGRVDADKFVPARWDLLPEGRYMWGSVQTVRGCPKHCSFCSVWRTDGQKPRQRGVDSVVAEIVELRRRGFRFVALADDNFYPVTLADLRDGGAPEQHGAPRAAAGAAGRAIRADGAAGEAAARHGVLHANHDGSGRGRGVPRRHADGEHQGRARRRRGRHARRVEGRLQGLQPGRRRVGRAAPQVPRARRATSLARSSSDCRATGRRRSTRRRMSPSARNSPSRSSSC